MVLRIENTNVQLGTLPALLQNRSLLYIHKIITFKINKTGVN